jgi:xanthine dehydrogenase accessory factor
MDRREAERLVAAVARARAAGEPAALATVVRVQGSAYRREGTRMLVRRDGTYACAISGGCLEPAVADAAARVIDTGEPRLLRYDLADPSPWGLNIGCSGAVDILIERLDEGDEAMEAWLGVVERGEAAVLLTPLSGVSGRRLIHGSGPGLGHLSDAAVEAAADRIAGEWLAALDQPSATERIGSAEVFVEVNQPPPSLVIFGAGDDAVPVAGQAWTIGFVVSIVDPRAGFLEPARFPYATRIVSDFEGLDPVVSLDRSTLVVIMNHHLERDRLSLRFALESPAEYIGVLGPRPRLDKLLDGLAREGYVPAPEDLSRIRSPIGLALGGETPDEVALAIVGELLAVTRGFGGGYLTGSGASLHRAARRRAFARS